MKSIKLLLPILCLLSQGAFGLEQSEESVSYRSCDIFLSQKITWIYSINQRTTKKDMNELDEELLLKMTMILASKGYRPYTTERRDGLSIRQKYNQNINSSFNIYYHSIYAYLDIIEEGKYYQFDNFYRSSVRNFKFENYNSALLRTISSFPLCIEE